MSTRDVKVGVLGATGTVGQRYVLHPFLLLVLPSLTHTVYSQVHRPPLRAPLLQDPRPRSIFPLRRPDVQERREVEADYAYSQGRRGCRCEDLRRERVRRV